MFWTIEYFFEVWHNSTNFECLTVNLKAVLVCFFLFARVPWSLFVYPSPNWELSTPAALWVGKGQHAKGSFLCPVSSVNPDWPVGWEESQGYNNATCACWMLHKQDGKKRARKKILKVKMSLFPALGIRLCDRTSLHKGIFKSQQSALPGLSGWASASFPVQLKSWQHFEASETRDRTKRRNLIGAYEPYGDCKNIKYKTACEVSRMETLFFLFLYHYIFLTAAEMTLHQQNLPLEVPVYLPQRRIEIIGRLRFLPLWIRAPVR